jgi:hypothetical protein
MITGWIAGLVAAKLIQAANDRRRLNPCKKPGNEIPKFVGVIKSLHEAYNVGRQWRSTKIQVWNRESI